MSGAEVATVSCAGCFAGLAVLNLSCKRQNLTSWWDFLGVVASCCTFRRELRAKRCVEAKEVTVGMVERFQNGEKVEEVVGFKARSSDVFVATQPKSGTTLLQHMCHQIRVGGKLPDWEDQLEVMPHLELTDVFNSLSEIHFLELDEAQPANPRVYKSHLAWKSLPSTGKKIYCFRDLEDMIFSLALYTKSNHNIEWFPTESLVSFLLLTGVADKLHTNLVEWWEHRHDEDVLFLLFDELLEDRAAVIGRVAAFMDVPLESDVFDLVLEQTSHKWMSSPEHKHRFDDRRMLQSWYIHEGVELTQELCGKVRKDGGKAGQGSKGLSARAKTVIQQSWVRVVAPKTGFKSFADLQASWLAERQAKSGLLGA